MNKTKKNSLVKNDETKSKTKIKTKKNYAKVMPNLTKEQQMTICKKFPNTFVTFEDKFNKKYDNNMKDPNFDRTKELMKIYDEFLKIPKSIQPNDDYYTWVNYIWLNKPQLISKNEKYAEDRQLEEEQKYYASRNIQKIVRGKLGQKQIGKKKEENIKNILFAFDELGLDLNDYKKLSELIFMYLEEAYGVEEAEAYERQSFKYMQNKDDLQEFIVRYADENKELQNIVSDYYLFKKSEIEGIPYEKEMTTFKDKTKYSDTPRKPKPPPRKYDISTAKPPPGLPPNKISQTTASISLPTPKSEQLDDFLNSLSKKELQKLYKDIYKTPPDGMMAMDDLIDEIKKAGLERINKTLLSTLSESTPSTQQPTQKAEPKPKREFVLNNRQRKPKIFEIPESNENPIVGSVQDTYDYVVDKIESMGKQDFYDRFRDVKLNSYYERMYPNLLNNKDGSLKNLQNFSNEYSITKRKNGKPSLIEILLTVEFPGATDLDETLLNVIQAKIEGIAYKPDREFDPYSDAPIMKTQGFGMKKKKGGDLIHIDIGSHIGKNYKEAEGKGVKQQMKLFEKVKKNYQSGGDQPYIKSRIKIGSGVAVAEKEPTYQEFGKFVIHIPQLRKNILNVKYASGSRPQYLPIVNIDDDTKDLLITTLETGRMSENHFNKLPQPAKDFLIKAIKGAGLQNQLFKGKDKLYATEEKEDRDRFNILKGEFDAGNDNPNLIKELRGLVIKFIDTRIIPKKQGLEFLRQLN